MPCTSLSPEELLYARVLQKWDSCLSPLTRVSTEHHGENEPWLLHKEGGWVSSASSEVVSLKMLLQRVMVLFLGDGGLRGLLEWH